MDGMYQPDCGPGVPEGACYSRILTDLLAFGDLNSDGSSDAAAIIASRYGGTGVFITLAAILNNGGMAENTASTLLGDRVVVETASVSRGEIVLDMLIHPSPDSPEWAGMCCPSVPVTLRFRLESSGLVEVR
jgi:hypothetical protein